VEILFENARRILDVAANAEANGPDEFAVLMSSDSGIRILMNQPFRVDAAVMETGADAGYRVVRTRSGVRVEGYGRGENCVLEQRAKQPAARTGPWTEWLLDQPLYRISSPLLTSTASA
jgi:hypothetical protein